MMEHLRPLYGACQLLAVANIPQEVKDGLRLGRMTALASQTAGVRGIVAGGRDSTTYCSHHCSAVGEGSGGLHSTIPVCFSTKAGCECIPHTLQALCELNPEATVISADGMHSIWFPDAQCWKVSTLSQVGCRLFEFFFVVNLICGRMRRGLCTSLTKEKEASKGTCHVLMPLLFS